MISEKDLLQNNYKRFDDSFLSVNKDPSYVSSFQKRIDDEKGKKYYINFNLYDMSAYREDFKYSWEVHVQFNTNSDDNIKFPTYCLKVYISNEHSLNDIEQYYEKFWKGMNCDYYQYWQ